VDFRFVAWATRENWLTTLNELADGVKARLDAEGIEIPYPHVSLYTGSQSLPLQMRVVSDPDPSGGRETAPGGAPETG